MRGRPNFDANAANPGESYPVEWVTIEEPNPPNDTVRVQAQSNGAAIFDRTEGIWSAERSLYFDCTTGGEAQLGQLWQYTPRGRSGGVLKLIYESTSIDDLEGPDNLVVVPHTGDVFLQEDASGEQFVRGVTRRGTIFQPGWQDVLPEPAGRPRRRRPRGAGRDLRDLGPVRQLGRQRRRRLRARCRRFDKKRR